MKGWTAILPRGRVFDAALAFGETCEDPVLHAYLSLADPAGDWARRAVVELNREIEGAEMLWATQKWGLDGGLAGLGWDVQHVARLLGTDARELNAHTDVALLQELQRGRWQGSPDDLVGIGVYFVERCAPEGIALVLSHLESVAEASGLLAFLVSAGDVAAVERAASAQMARGGGQADVFFEAARLTGRAEHREFASSLLERTLASGTGHGHAFNRIYQEEGDERCLEAARAWCQKTEPRHPGEALALLAATTSIAPGWDRRYALGGTS